MEVRGRREVKGEDWRVEESGVRVRKRERECRASGRMFRNRARAERAHLFLRALTAGSTDMLTCARAHGTQRP